MFWRKLFSRLSDRGKAKSRARADALRLVLGAPDILKPDDQILTGRVPLSV
jgi:hypothetical protein